MYSYANSCKEKVQSMGIGPVTRQDLFDILVNKFAPDRFDGILDFGREVLGLDRAERDQLRQEVAFACLEIGCKGKMLKKLVDFDGNLKHAIAAYVLRTFHLSMDDLPSPDDEKACREFEARLCRDFMTARRPGIPIGETTEDRELAGGAVHALSEEDPTNMAGNEIESDDEEVLGEGETVTGEDEADLVCSLSCHQPIVYSSCRRISPYCFHRAP